MTTEQTKYQPMHYAAEPVATGSNPMKARGSAIRALKGLLKDGIAVVKAAKSISLLFALLMFVVVGIVSCVGIAARVFK